MKDFFLKCKTLEEAKIQYRKLAIENHPDKSGSLETMQIINAQYELVCFTLEKSKPFEAIRREAKDFENSYMKNYKFVGSRYDRNLDPADIIIKIRNFVKAVFPTSKFSVTRQNYHSFYICLMESPIPVFIPEEEFPTITEIGTPYHWNTSHHSVNHFWLNEDKILSEYGKFLFGLINDFIMSYNYDDSDSMSDYFNTNFYYSLSVGKWDKPFKIVEKTARIQGKPEVEKV